MVRRKKRERNLFKSKKGLSSKVSMVQPVYRDEGRVDAISSVFGEERKLARECRIMPGRELSKPTREDRICCTTSSGMPYEESKPAKNCSLSFDATSSEGTWLEGFDPSNTIFCDMDPKVSVLKKIGPKK